MILAASVGNAHTVLGLLAPPAEDGGPPGDVVAHWRVSTDEHRTEDEWAVLLRGLLRHRWDDVEGVALCATVPSVLDTWRRMTPRYLPELPAVVVEPGIRTGIPVRTENPREVGADRVMNAVAARTLVGAPAIVVDFTGTATIYDVVDAAGAHVGGAITAGIELSLQSLGRRGAQLRQVEVRRPRSVIARNTVEALQAGLVLGTAAQVDGMVDRITDELGVDPATVPVIASGYLAETVVADCRRVTHHRPFLTLEGLAIVFGRNHRDRS